MFSFPGNQHQDKITATSEWNSVWINYDGKLWPVRSRVITSRTHFWLMEL